MSETEKPTVESLLAMAREDYEDPERERDPEGESFEDFAENFLEGHLEVLLDDEIIDRRESDRLWVGIIGTLRP
jgi:hypothetical protein